MNESESRIIINKLLEKSGWQFAVNIKTEQAVKITNENIKSADYLLFDSKGFPLCVVEAKRSEKSPLEGKEQARRYARELRARYVILSNGEYHYFWDTEQGNPKPIYIFPTQKSLEYASEIKLHPEKLSSIIIDENYIAETQMPNFQDTPEYKAGGETCDKFISDNNLIILRPYQLGAIHAVQNAAKENKERYLLEMATGTGKTKTTIALSKLFLSTGNARRILFLVDRIELEEQAAKDFKNVLKDWVTIIYKENKSDWQKANIVITTVQSLMHNDKYKKEFSPTDFELVVSDEAHRSINGNARAVFEYFIGYKLGLTATPKDYLKNLESKPDSKKNIERRELLDTYKTFGCDNGEPTYRYDLLTGARDGFLIQPYVLDARTKITTELLSQDGLEVERVKEDGATEKQIYFSKHFERKFFNEATNFEFCKQILDNGVLDPITGEYGKTLIFCRTQRHAVKITQVLNDIAHKKWLNIYNSNFAVQITSNVEEAQQMTTNFTNNKLSGNSIFNEENFPDYKTSKTRICVTVGMMTTGYDCPDLLNIAFLRPVFSPSDFIQMKGRGTRKHNFVYKPENIKIAKETFKLFDFFAVCEFFENDFKYDKALKLPANIVNINTPDPSDAYDIGDSTDSTKTISDDYDHASSDMMKSIKEEQISGTGMRVDREAFGPRLREELSKDETLKGLYNSGDESGAIEYFKQEIYDKPNLFVTRDKVRLGFGLDRLPSFSEILEYVFGDRDGFDNSKKILDRSWADFTTTHGEMLDDTNLGPAYDTFTAYAQNANVRTAIDTKLYAKLDEYGLYDEWNTLSPALRVKIPSYARDFVVERV